MPFLLLLSALLTALTGVVSGVRAVEIITQCPSAVTSGQRFVVATVRAVAGHTHLLNGFGTVASFAAGTPVVAISAAAPRLYLDRPRA